MSSTSNGRGMAAQAFDAGEDTELNMTPMIDIVFQLIIFFMLTLKFKEIDRRIDSALPHKSGIGKTVTFQDEIDKIKIKVFRRNLKESDSKHYTLVKIDNTHQYRLPEGWLGATKEVEVGGGIQGARVSQYNATIEKILAVVQQKLRVHPGTKGEVKGEIVAPSPMGGSVPHGDVMVLLDVFLRAGITDVVFEGQATPLSSSERARRAAN